MRITIIILEFIMDIGYEDEKGKINRLSEREKGKYPCRI